jgi:2-polyprenyl-6-methoxyphenol hydroxylase-like FAD-dependent oxidoreductase
MKLFMVHVGFYDPSIGDGIYETHLNYFIAAENAKDAKTKTHELAQFKEKSMHIDQALTLKRYEIRRKNMNLLMLKSMDFFVNLFGSKNLYIKLLRNFGLSGVNKTQFLKKFFINHAAGKNQL